VKKKFGNKNADLNVLFTEHRQGRKEKHRPRRTACYLPNTRRGGDYPFAFCISIIKAATVNLILTLPLPLVG